MACIFNMGFGLPSVQGRDGRLPDLRLPAKPQTPQAMEGTVAIRTGRQRLTLTTSILFIPPDQMQS